MKTFQPKFVEFMPEVLEDGLLYISPRFALISHRCPCGCGEEVVLKLSPSDWQMVFDGEAVSIYPSVGNWGLPCRSHYWIVENRVEWATSWSEAKIKARRAENNPSPSEPKAATRSFQVWAFFRRKWFRSP